MASVMITQESTVAAAGAEAGTRPAHTDDDPTRVASLSMVISGIRCVLAYVIFPWVLPALGVARGVGPAIGIAVGLVAIVSNVASIRRFQRSRHRWRWPVTVVNAGVIVLLLILLVIDVRDLAG